MKRFTDTERFEDEWYLKLSCETRCAWEFIWARCDQAGVWNPSETLIRVYVGPNMALDRAYKELSQKVEKLANGKWFIKGFISFQQGGPLSNLNPCHKKIRNLLNQHEIDEEGKALIRPCEGPAQGHSNSSSTGSGSTEGGTGGNEVELPVGFPKVEKDALVHCDFVGSSEEFCSTVWNKCMSRGGRDAKGQPITSFRHYLKTEMDYAASRSHEPNGHQVRNGADTVVLNSEHERVLSRMKTIKDQYEAHQSWDAKDKSEYSKLKTRRGELRAILGITV